MIPIDDETSESERFVEQAKAYQQWVEGAESRTVMAFQRVFDNPDGHIVLEWLSHACYMKERRLATGMQGLSALDLAGREALRSLFNEIEWMTKGAQ